MKRPSGAFILTVSPTWRSARRPFKGLPESRVVNWRRPASVGGNEQCGVGRVRDEIHEWQVVVIGDTLIESLRANPISRKDCVAETHTPGLGEQRGFVELREGENAPRDEDIAKRTVGGRE